MTVAIIINAVFMTLLLLGLGAWMSLPFRLPSGERVQARARRREAARERRAERARYRGTERAEVATD
jgi:hypothetical protein